MKDPSPLVLTLLERYRVLDWATGKMCDMLHDPNNPNANNDNDDTHQKADDFLNFFLSSLTERFQTHVGKVSKEEQRRHEMIQVMCLGPTTPHVYQDYLQRDRSCEDLLDQVAAQVGDRVTTASKTTYLLKPGLFSSLRFKASINFFI